MIGIIDYGMGNLRSLRNAIAYVGIDVDVVAKPDDLQNFSHIILPGVGAFGAAARNLEEGGFEPAIRRHADARKPLLGICLGMQLLATTSFEFGTHRGLGLIPGEVRGFEPTTEHPVPHVGWNTIRVERPHPFLQRVKKVVDYYFVHSFHFCVEHDTDRLASTDYGIPFSAVVGHANVVGCQFHPEKSQAGGLALLEGFAEWDGSV